jgi:hypothetical protein
VHGLRIPTKSAGDAGLMSATTAVAVVPDELLTGIKGASAGCRLAGRCGHFCWL